MLKRTVSLSTYNFPMLWFDPHLYEKVFYAHTLPATEGSVQWRGGGGGNIFGIFGPVGVGHGRNWPRVV